MLCKFIKKWKTKTTQLNLPLNLWYTLKISLDEQFKNVCADIQKISKTARHLQLTVKELQRHVKNACKPKR